MAEAAGVFDMGDPPARTYHDYYGNEGTDTFHGNYGRVMEDYALERPGVKTAAQLATAVFDCSTQRIPTAFLVLGARPGVVTPTIQCYHRVTKFRPRLGMPASLWDDDAFAFHGDLVNNQVSVVSWNAALFGPAAIDPIVVGTDDLVSDGLAVNANVEMLGPFMNDALGTVQVQVRRTVYVPPMFVNVLLEEEVTPRQAWEQLGGAIRDAQMEDECRPLLNWLKVALTRREEGASSILSTNALTPPLSNRMLMERQWAWIVEDLPSLGPAAVAEGKDQIATELGELVHLQQVAAEEKRCAKRAKENKLPSEAFGGQIVNVMRLCQVAEESQLPGVWHDLAKTPVKQHRTVIQKWVDQVSDEIADGLELIVTPTLVKKVTTLEFIMRNKHSLESGMHPFIFNQHHAEEREQASEVASLYDFVNGGQVGAGLSDAQMLLANDPIGFPRMTSEGRGMILRDMIWFAVFLGTEHEIVHQHMQFTNRWSRGEAEYEILVPQDTAMAGFVPTIFTRWFQLRECDYISRQWNSAALVPVPDFMVLFQRIEIGDPWEVRLPTRYDRVLREGGGMVPVGMGS